MVSKARLDLPDPDSPVKTIMASRGRSSETSFRLCSRAPRTIRRSDTSALSAVLEGFWGGPDASGTDTWDMPDHANEAHRQKLPPAIRTGSTTSFESIFDSLRPWLHRSKRPGCWRGYRPPAG